MCGIVGYVGSRNAQSLILEGLRRLEYRGYDSAGIATIHDGSMDIRKAAGKIAELERRLEKEPLPGSHGIGHTRWATHGAPTTINAHPHTDGSGRVALVHNGIIENHDVLRSKLEELGHEFRSGDRHGGPVLT